MGQSLADPDAARRGELAANLHEVQQRVARAAQRAGRSADSVRLVVITKTWPVTDVRLLAALGVKDVGENRDQEAAPKAAAVRELGLRWHFVGQLQTNKARSVAEYTDVVESVDRLRLVGALDSAAEKAGRRLNCLVQVSLESVPGRGGATPSDVPKIADAVADSTWLELGGLMAVAPLDADPDPAFGALRRIFDDLLRDHPEALVLSAGMSHDLESAIEHGATQVRVGGAVLGPRSIVG